MTFLYCYIVSIINDFRLSLHEALVRLLQFCSCCDCMQTCEWGTVATLQCKLPVLSQQCIAQCNSSVTQNLYRIYVVLTVCVWSLQPYISLYSLPVSHLTIFATLLPLSCSGQCTYQKMNSEVALPTVNQNMKWFSHNFLSSHHTNSHFSLGAWGGFGAHVAVSGCGSMLWFLCTKCALFLSPIKWWAHSLQYVYALGKNAPPYAVKKMC